MAWGDAVSGSQITVAELYIFTLANGTIHRFTSFAQDISFQSYTYTAIPISRTEISKDSDLSVGETTVTLPYHDDYIDTTDLLDRLLDNAKLELYQIDRSDHNNYRLNFRGWSGEVSANNHIIEIKFNNLLNVLFKKIPRRIFSTSCPYQFGDSDCQLVLSTVKVAGTAESGSDADTIVDASLNEATDYWKNGYVEMTSGDNDGKKRAIKSFSGGTVELIVPFPDAVSIGDTFDIYPHCEKRFEKCEDLGNEENFGGFQYIPRPEEI